MERGKILKGPVFMFKCTAMDARPSTFLKKENADAKKWHSRTERREEEDKGTAYFLFSPFIHRGKDHCLQTSEPPTPPAVSCGRLFSPPVCGQTEVCRSLSLCEMLKSGEPGGLN